MRRTMKILDYYALQRTSAEGKGLIWQTVEPLLGVINAVFAMARI